MHSSLLFHNSPSLITWVNLSSTSSRSQTRLQPLHPILPNFLVPYYPRHSPRQHICSRICCRLFLLGDHLHPVLLSLCSCRPRTLIKVQDILAVACVHDAYFQEEPSPHCLRRAIGHAFHRCRLCKTCMPRRTEPSAHSWANYSLFAPQASSGVVPRRRLPAPNTCVSRTRARPRISFGPPRGVERCIDKRRG